MKRAIAIIVLAGLAGLGHSLLAAQPLFTNNLRFLGAASGSNPAVVAEGVDTNIGMDFTPKGTGQVRFGGGAPLVPLTDNTADLGIDLTNRWRSGFFGTSLSSPLYTSPGGASPTAISVLPGAAVGSNITGANLTVSGGTSTGTASGGAVVVKVGPSSGTPGTGVNAAVTAATFSPNLHYEASGTAPGVAGGGAPTIVGNDQVGKVTAGGAGNITVTFNKSWTLAPSCWCNNETSNALCSTTTTTTTAVLAGTFALNNVVAYGCFGRQ